ncbi:MAG: hypothetical protein OEY86_00780 [Nitrospira sp.]|nr:hypothetical protein [Nitrospira sp.]
MTSYWPLIFKICVGLTIVQFAGGIVYRFFFLHGADIDLGHFTTYVSVTILLLISGRLLQHLLLHDIKETAFSFSPKKQIDGPPDMQTPYWVSLSGGLYGSLLPIVRWPLALVTVTIIEALWGGQNLANKHEALTLKLFGLGSMTTYSYSSKLIFYSAWFLIGTLAINLGLRFFWMRASNSGTSVPP